MTRYNWQLLPELVWVLVITVVSVVLAALADLDAASVTDWKTWLIGVGFASIRAGAAAAIAVLGRGAFSTGAASTTVTSPPGAPPPP